MKERSKIRDFTDLLQRAGGYGGEPLAANLIASHMSEHQKLNSVNAYNTHIDQSNQDEKLLDMARAACLLMRRPDLQHKIYELLLTPPERV